MGEAKRKQQHQRNVVAFLARLDRWCFPATEAEAAVVAEITLLPKIPVRRWPSELLSGMKSNECHPNAWRFVESHPKGKCRQISGWWPMDGHFVLHSVVELEGEFICVTPYGDGASSVFPFIPDPLIEWRQEGPVRRAYRKGYKIELGVRSDPVESMRVTAVVRARVLAGMDAQKAQQGPF